VTRTLWRVGLVAALAAAGGACARKPPAVAPPPPPPALEVPVVPPRVLAPVSEPEPPPVQEPEPAQAPRRERPRTPPRPAGSGQPAEGREPGRPAEAPVEGASPEARPAGQAAAPLRTPQTANDAEAERRVRDTLGRASGVLGKVNRSALSADAQAQYDAARRFVDQAQDALRVRNYMFAAYLADKAEALARGLQGR
jgi:hypothetical protein